MYNRDPVTLFKLTNNQRDSNPVPSSLSGESLTINDHSVKMDNIYQSMITKAYTNIIKFHMPWQKYYNMQAFIKPFSEGNKSLEKHGR